MPENTLERNSATGYRLTEDPQPQYLRISVAGQWDNTFVGEVSKRIFDLCARYQARRVLIDVRELSGTLSMMGRFYLASQFAARYIKARLSRGILNCRFAVSGHPPFIDPNRFGEKVAVNHGLPVRVFTDFEEALAWLLAD